jgi:hypothetical protein
MHTRRLRFVCFLQNRIILNRAVWLGALAAAVLLTQAPANAQGPSGAAAAAAGAAVEATFSAAAKGQKKSAAAAAEAAGEASRDNTSQTTGTAASLSTTEEAANGAAQPGNGVPAEKGAPAPVLKGVAAQCANLLKLATSLKAEVAKTNKDELSVPVVRDAGQIERLARQMRDKH